MRIVLTAATVLFAVLCVACGGAATPEQVPANAMGEGETAHAAPVADSNNDSLGRGGESIIEAIRGYKEWKRVADLPRFAPTLCGIPPADRPFLSEADAGPHDRKLYYLYVKEERRTPPTRIFSRLGRLWSRRASRRCGKPTTAKATPRIASASARNCSSC